MLKVLRTKLRRLSARTYGLHLNLPFRCFHTETMITLSHLQICTLPRLCWTPCKTSNVSNRFEFNNTLVTGNTNIKRFRRTEIEIIKSLSNQFLIQLRIPTWMSPYKRSPGPGLCSPQTLCSKTPDWWQDSVKLTVPWLPNIFTNSLHLEVEVAAIVVNLVNYV